jgi:Protein of unknown function (DUF2975)
VERRVNGTLAVAQWVLRALAVLSLLGAAAGVLGASGTRSLYDRHVPTQVGDQAQRLWPQSASLPSSPVLVRPSHWQDSYEVFNELPIGGGRMPLSWAPLSRGTGEDVVGHVGQLTFWDPGMFSRAAWLVAIALIPVGLAWLWWTLSRIVGSARRGGPFTHRNARRLAVAAALVGLGPMLALLAQQAVVRWMLASSTAAGKADIWFRWERVPLWPLGVGLALLVLAAVWRRGVAMREDLEGLV